MNKKEQRALENRIRDVMEEPAELTSDEIAKIRERAYLGYQQKIENEKQPAREKKKKSGLLRRAVAVVAIAIGLIVVSVVYSVLAPVTVGNANSFVRRAAIWVNDQLHLRINFPQPTEEEGNVIINDSSSFSSFEEASIKLGTPLVYIDGINDIILEGIESNRQEKSFFVSIRYKLNDEQVIILIEPALDTNTLSILSNDTSIIETPIGEVYLWENEAGMHAVTLLKKYYIEINSTIPRTRFTEICKSLNLIY